MMRHGPANPIFDFPQIPWSAAALALVLVLASGPARGQWTEAAPGIETAVFNVDGHRLTVARLDRSEPTAVIDTAIAQGSVEAGRELVADMAEGNEDTLLYWDGAWGPRRDVVVAVNGSFFDLDTGVPHGGQMIDGWYIRRHDEMGGNSGFSWWMNTATGHHEFFIGGCVHYRDEKNLVTYAGGATQTIEDVDVARPAGALIIYTPYFAPDTGTDGSGVEVLVELSRPLLLIPTPSGVQGTVTAVRESAGSTFIPFDHVVLSATGAAGTALLANAAVGDAITISQELTHYDHDCSTRNTDSWEHTLATIGGNFHFLRDGVIYPYTENAGAVSFRSRTAVAYNESYIFFVVVDEVSGSSGVNMQQFGELCRDELGATDAVNQDGGGSSRMWVNGEIVNSPSDPSRTVANAIMMVTLKDSEFSTTFLAGDTVETTADAALRLGPGTNYAGFSSVAGASRAAVLDHQAAGVLATGRNWWKCDFDGQAGWVDEAVLSLVFRPEPDPELLPEGETLPEGSEPLSDPSIDADVFTDTSGDAAIDPSTDPSTAELDGGCGCRVPG